MMRFISLLIALVMLTSCAAETKLKIAKTIEGPKEIHIVLVNDPLLITMDLKSVLQQHGIDSTFSSEEVRKETIVKKDSDTSVVYKSSTDSIYRYQMTFSYRLHHNYPLVTTMVAQVWDSKEKAIIAKYRVANNDGYLDAEGASERLYNDFISKMF